jgi:hypothetical protein
VLPASGLKGPEYDSTRRVLDGWCYGRLTAQRGAAVWLNPDGNRNVPVVINGEANLNWLDNDWNGNYSFLFRK